MSGNEKTFNILVIGGVASYNWKELFKGETHRGIPIRIERVHWDEISLTSFHDSGVQLTLVPKQQSKNATTLEPIASYKPDFVIFRSAGRGIYGQDFRNVLYGLQHANVPSLNSLNSIYFCQEKPIIYGKLNSLRKKLGDDRFPLIPQTYYGSWKAMSFHTDLPVVVKFGTCHSGFGKMRITTDSDFEDIRSIAALQPNYVTAEPFIDWDYDIRIQKIGHHYRAFRRTSANWKGKGANQQDEDIEVTDRYKLWVDAASAEFGMDVCAVDAVHSRVDGKEYILELNDSAIGFNIRHQDEDFLHLKELILLRIAMTYPDDSLLPLHENDLIVANENNNNNNNDSNIVIEDGHKPRDEFESLPLEQQVLILKNRVRKLEKEKVEAAKVPQNPTPNQGGILRNLFK